jgi:TonB family protein
MMMPRLALIASLLSLAAVSAQQSVRPDFSGEWVLDASKSTSSGAPMGVSGPPLRRGGTPTPVAPGTIREPVTIKDVRPRYPPDAQGRPITGMVVLEAIIDRRGKVDDLRVVRSVPELDRAALEAVSQWEYTPTMFDGEAVPVIMTVTVTFSIDGAPPRQGVPVGGGWPAQPAGTLRPGYGRGVAPPAMTIKQDKDV